MLPIGQENTQPPCPYKLPQTLTLALGFTLITLTLLLIQRIARRHYQPTHTHSPASPAQPDQTDAMEKGNLTSPAPSTSMTMNICPPPATACDVLQPLSQSGAFPSSGAVAARARELMQTGKASPSSPGMDETVMAMVMARALGESEEGWSETCGPVQKRGESVLEMRDVDSDGVRTWRRVVAEYS
ncbi:uncharacterized protein N7496_012012 [Penicillium cataractarum]|uniref:Uncharacterized protein n=1 Tax=Penicillium cataractarum TaxID=2100454 RepID=A0A9W9RIS4_9EURO|nr:uncharacterized protein N7496_012012 [Penicillium cataractarum]KAJ5359599.1 hypothetical protein N7496_012012 [Penicillium cataractarum]